MAALVQQKNYCPCCGYPDLEMPAYENLGQPPWFDHGSPPYCHRYGAASYDVCSCCGFEYGFDDDPGASLGDSFQEYRRNWIAEGAVWFTPKRRPPDWDLQKQLQGIGILGND